MSFWKKISVSLGISAAPMTGKRGARAYAVGDVHGCLEQLDRLLAAIEADMAQRAPRETFIIFLGDLIDRGADSSGVVERLLHYAPTGARPIFVKGNHEEFLLRSLDAEPGVLRHWLEFGGRECAASYGLAPGRLLSAEDADAAALLREFIPATHRRFLEDFIDVFRFGDYVFVHAGIRPGVPLEQQRSSDLRWIREPFLSDRADHGFMVVHGHTIVDDVNERSNRIGIDTGAYRGGPLTALVIEDDQRGYIQVSSAPE